MHFTDRACSLVHFTDRGEKNNAEAETMGTCEDGRGTDISKLENKPARHEAYWPFPDAESKRRAMIDQFGFCDARVARWMGT